MHVLATLCLALQLMAPARTLDGRVVDPAGLPIRDASVVVSSSTVQVATAIDGTFRLEGLPADAVVLIVSAAGFAERVVTVRSDQSSVVVELSARGIVESVTVSANPEGLRVNTPASATVLDYESLAAAPAWTLDDQLRTVPGFSLFRRSSSRVANPTTQGVTLRGLAASGASRTLVLADGVPLNDPFGGWVYWDRLPAASIDRVEVARGGSSDLHGTDALGGAITIDTADSQLVRVVADGGSDETARVSAYAGHGIGNWQIFGAAEVFSTDGFVIVAPESRGPIDVPADSDHVSAFAGAQTPIGSARGEMRGTYFDEDRGNGTPFQTNATIIRQASAQASGEGLGGSWLARGFVHSQDYDQTFSAVASTRASERPTSIQHVDTGSAGGAFEWLRGGARQAWLLNVNYRIVDSDLFEGPPIVDVLPLQAAARQQSGGVVGQASFTPSDRWTLGFGARGEIWQSELRDGSTSQTVVGVFPRASVAWRASELLSLRGAIYDAYRTPTINELFRPFAAGNTLTQANPALTPEEAFGLEGSALIRKGLAAARVTGFWTCLSDAVVNVTLESSPTLILRQRQNAGQIRAAGVELEGDVRVGRHFALTGAGAFIDSTFVEGAGLDGLRVPQVPRWQASGGVIGTWRYASAALDWRFIGQQFDDDRNQFSLDASNTVNARVGWRPRMTIEIFAGLENAFDEEQDVGRTPIRTIGLPRTARIGLRWSSR
jgi:outer membrane receptor protein involved in Fe transport